MKYKWPTLKDRLNQPITYRKDVLIQLQKVLPLSKKATLELKNMGLFKKENIILHSKQKSDFKIECDNLTYEDVETLCYLISKKYKFFSVFGVPNGGLKFAECLKQYRSLDSTLPTLVIDDVLTTGNSMEDFVKDNNIKQAIGVVIFARGRCPFWINPIFQMW